MYRNLRIWGPLELYLPCTLVVGGLFVCVISCGLPLLAVLFCFCFPMAVCLPIDMVPMCSLFVYGIW